MSRLAATFFAAWSAVAAAQTGLEFLEPQDIAFVEVRGTVRNDTTGAPIAGAAVLAIWEGTIRRGRHCLRADAAITGRDGSFSLKTPSRNVYRKGMAMQYVDIRIHAEGMQELFLPGTTDRKMQTIQDQRSTLAKLIPPKEYGLDVSARMVPTTQDVPDRVQALRLAARQPSGCETMGDSDAVKGYFTALASEAKKIATTRYQRAVAEVLAEDARLASFGLESHRGTSAQLMEPVYRSPELTDLERRDGADMTPLMKAASDGNAAEIRALLAAGASPNRTLGATGLTDGDSALTLAMSKYLDFKINNNAQAARYPPAIQALLADSKTNPDLRGLPYAYTPLMKALRHSQDDVVEWLLAAGADPNLTAYNAQYTAMGEALQALQTTRDGKPLPPAVHQFELLIASKRTNLDLIIGDGGATPVTRSLVYGYADTARKLLEAGAKPNALDRMKRTPLTASVSASIINPQHPKFLECVRLVASWPGVDFNAQYEGKTAMQMAQSAGRKDLVAILEKR